MNAISYRNQQGVFLLEALIAIIIFSIGVLTMVALQAKAIDVQSDAQYRIEAANLADRILGEIALNVDRTSDSTVQASLAGFAHRETTSSPCNFSGVTSSNANVVAWLADINTNVATRLPGTTSSMQQIRLDTGTFNQITITICWQSAADAVPRRHTLVSYIN